jgi:hypothetical protein
MNQTPKSTQIRRQWTTYERQVGLYDVTSARSHEETDALKVPFEFRGPRRHRKIMGTDEICLLTRSYTAVNYGKYPSYWFSDLRLHFFIFLPRAKGLFSTKSILV